MNQELSYVGMFNCFICGEPAGVLLDRRLRATLPRNVGCVDQTPCQKCQDYMKQGIVLISVDPHKTKDLANPWRSGGWAVIKEHGFRRVFSRLFPESLVEQVVTKRVAFIEDEVWDRTGLPRKTKETT